MKAILLLLIGASLNCLAANEDQQEHFVPVDFKQWEARTPLDGADPEQDELEPIQGQDPAGVPHKRSLTGSLSANCPMFSGFFRSSYPSSILKEEILGFTDMASAWSTLSNQGKRLVDVNARVDGNNVYYSMVFQNGAWAHYMFQHAGFDAMTTNWDKLSKEGNRLVRLETFVVGSTPYYVSIFKPGNQAYYLFQYTSLASLKTKIAELAAKKVYIIDFETFNIGNVRYFVGVFLGSSPQSYLEADLEWSAFLTKHNTHSGAGRKLIDFDRYYVNSKWLFTGIYASAPGSWGLWVNVDEENMLAQIENMKRPLAGIEVHNGFCKAECCNDVVGTSYNYLITGDSTTYRWPVTNGKIRLSAIHFSGNPKFRLPFSDASVVQTSGWRYTSSGAPGGYHHAVDYSKGAATFAVKSVQAGKVIFVGWDNWSGNTVVVEHAGGWRSIYMHLRNGKTNDCNKALTVTVPWLSNPSESRTDYLAYLSNSGCTNPNPKPLENYWGKDSEKILVKVNQLVNRGTQLAWAGNTGPGGKRGSGLGENTHLHIFFTRKDSTDNRWYFIDPYGVYAYTACYPASVLGPLTSCSRYPTAFEISNGKLLYA